jgi:hypothetical protein
VLRSALCPLPVPPPSLSFQALDCCPHVLLLRRRARRAVDHWGTEGEAEQDGARNAGSRGNTHRDTDRERESTGETGARGTQSRSQKNAMRRGNSTAGKERAVLFFVRLSQGKDAHEAKTCETRQDSLQCSVPQRISCGLGSRQARMRAVGKLVGDRGVKKGSESASRNEV